MSDISLKKIYSGKVRDLYEIDEQRMLMVASDRLSAFDVILDDPIPGKGEILTQISNFWFQKLAHIMPNHFTGNTVYDVLPEDQARALEKRAVVAKKLEPVKVEAIVRDERSIMTVSSLLHGEYDIDDLYLSVPAIFDIFQN